MQKISASSARSLDVRAGGGMRMTGSMTTGTGSTTRFQRGHGPS